MSQSQFKVHSLQANIKPVYIWGHTHMVACFISITEALHFLLVHFPVVFCNQLYKNNTAIHGQNKQISPVEDYVNKLSNK